MRQPAAPLWAQLKKFLLFDTVGWLPPRRFVMMPGARQLVGFAATHLRGGAWFNNNNNARAVNRNNNPPGNRNNNTGFRLVVARPTPFVPLQWPEARASARVVLPFIRERRLPVLLVEYALPAAAKN